MNIHFLSRLLFVTTVALCFAVMPGWAADAPANLNLDTNSVKAAKVPVIDVTDLYHPCQDIGDNFDLLTAYALPEIDLRAVILDPDWLRMYWKA